MTIGGEVFPNKNSPEGHTGTHKSLFFSYKQVSVRNGDHEWLIWSLLSYYVIYYEMKSSEKSWSEQRRKL